MKIIRFCRALFMLGVTPLLTLLVSLAALIWLGLLRQSATSAQAIVRWWGRVLCRLGGITVRIEGLKHLPPGQPVIFAANHLSQCDIIVLQGFLAADFRWLAKKELFKVPIWGTAMRMADYIPIDRSHGRQAMKSLDEAARRIAEGTSVVIFPEGTRSRDGRLQPFKAGGMVLAIKAGVLLVPVAIHGTHEILPKGSLLMQPGHVRIRLGQPIETRNYRAKDKQDLALRLQEAVAALLKDSTAGDQTGTDGMTAGAAGITTVVDNGPAVAPRQD